MKTKLSKARLSSAKHIEAHQAAVKLETAAKQS
jgi:hypothetical protein